MAIQKLTDREYLECEVKNIKMKLNSVHVSRKIAMAALDKEEQMLIAQLDSIEHQLED